jgi:hypothetical protein
MSDANDAVIATGLIADPNFDFFNPSMAANANGSVMIGFTRSGVAATGPAGNASAMVITGRTIGSTTTFDAPITLKQGLVNDYHLFGGKGERWGDRSSVTVDPVDYNTFWTTQEYALSTNRWGNWVAAVRVTPGVDGDTNVDGKVNITDLDSLTANWGLATGAVWIQGDFNGDGAVNISDLDALAGNWGFGTTVPEPGTFVLLALGGFLAARRCHRPFRLGRGD